VSTQIIRWLHISDLHLGQRGGEVWWQVREEFRVSLERMLKELGPPHLVLLTGDLAFSGALEQYELVDRFLEALRGWIAAAGGDPPLVVAVPGNHDLQRPEAERAREYLFLEMYDELDNPVVSGERKRLWEESDASSIAPLFEGYSAWLTRSLIPRLEGRGHELHRSFFPGDLSIIVEPEPGFRLGLVGLNAAWAQYHKGDFERKLQLPATQFQAALQHSADGPLSFFRRCHRALLLMHQPPMWLTERAEAEFYGSVYTPDRFAACLYGHLHEGRCETVNLFGATRCYFQARSLFGLEHYGTLNEERSFGYAFGSISSDGEVRIWPLWRFQRGAMHWAFVRDERYEMIDASGAARLRSPDAPSSDPRAEPEPIVARDQLDDYRRWALDKYGDMELRGVGAGDFRLRMNDVYVPLRIMARAPSLDPEAPGCGPLALKRGLDDIDLLEAFGHAGPERKLAIFGDPGAGKTTALRKLLHQVLTVGPASIGLDGEALPVFLRLRRLDRDRLGWPISRFIQDELEEMAPSRFAGLGEALWQRGDLLLLLDGLDEVPDAHLRAEVCRSIESSLTGLDGIACAVSCRYAGYGGDVSLGCRFLHLDVRPLDHKLIGRLVRAWFAAAHQCMAARDEPAAEVGHRAAEEAADLLSRLDELTSQRFKVLISNPLLLTLLCVVVLRGGEIPRGRAQFYGSCLDVLLGSWLRGKKGAPPLAPEEALSLLRPVAYFLHSQGRRDDMRPEELIRVMEPHLAPLRRKLGQSLPADEVLGWLHRRAGVLTEYSPGRYGFMHLGLQEYLTAAHIAREGGRPLRELAANIGAEWWEEVLLLSLALPEHHVFEPLMTLVAKSDALVREWDLIRRCLNESHEVLARPFLPLFRWPRREKAHMAAALRLFADRPEPELVAAAEKAARDRDPSVAAAAQAFFTRASRPEAPPAGPVAPGQAFVEPLLGINFIWIPGGRYQIGAEDIPFPGAFNPQWVEVPPFLLAETPVTNRQYGLFLDATGHEEPAYWRERRFSDPEQPVVGVNWHDATTFCEWLSEASGLTMALPSEVQWEVAARGADGRRYPWGENEPTPELANFAENTDTTTTVGAYPSGRGPFGHLDLAGNVWEWCGDDVNEDFCQDAEGIAKVLYWTEDDVRAHRALRTLRGGCWIRDAPHLRSAFRLRYPAWDQNHDVGFRVAAASAVSFQG